MMNIKKIWNNKKNLCIFNILITQNLYQRIQLHVDPNQQIIEFYLTIGKEWINNKKKMSYLVEKVKFLKEK